MYNNCLVENLQETACGGSVLSTGGGRSMTSRRFYVSKSTAGIFEERNITIRKKQTVKM